MIWLLAILASQAIASPQVVQTEGDAFRMPEITYLCDPTGSTDTVNCTIQLSFFKVAPSNYLHARHRDGDRVLLDDVKLTTVVTTNRADRSSYSMQFQDRETAQSSRLEIEVVPGTRATMSLHAGAISYEGWHCRSVPASPMPQRKWAKEPSK
jgi:hypothetical protein